MINRTEKRILLIVLLVMAALWLLPLYWMGVSAFKTDAEITRPTPTFWPRRWTGRNFVRIWRGFQRPLLNSIIVSGTCTILIVIFSAMAGYVLAKKNFWGRRGFLTLIVSTMLIPPSVLIVPLYCIIVSIGLFDTLAGLILPFSVTAFGVFLMRQFAMDIPDELIESARIDGCGDWTIFWRIVVPLLRPAMAVLAIIEFVNNWNAFTMPFVLVSSAEKKTLQLALADIRMAYEITPWGEVMAGATLTILPIIILFLIFQRRIIGSIMRGAVKG